MNNKNILVKHKDGDKYISFYIFDDKIEEYIKCLNDNFDLKIKDYIKLFDTENILLVLDIKDYVINNFNQKYYRLFNGYEIFWGEVESFEAI